MRRGRSAGWFCGAIVALAAAAAPATARATSADEAAPADLRRLFPREADVTVERAGLSRIVLPAEIVAACRPDLSDLRLFDPGGGEVPFIVDAGVPPGGGRELVQRHEPRVLEASRTTVARDKSPALRREIYGLTTPDPAQQAGDWALVIDVAAREFVARVRVETIGPGGESSPLVQEGSIFRLGGTRPVAKDRIPLPRPAGSGLRITLETEQAFWLEPAFRLESARALEVGGRIDVPLEIVSVENREGRTFVDLLRPPGIVPNRLRVDTATGTFDRPVEVSDEGPAGGQAMLGSGRLFRVQAIVPVGDQEVDLRVPHGDRLRVTIEDGDSPPLEDLRFAAVIRQPSLIFALPAGAPGAPAGVVRFGGGRALRPRYDLEGLLPPAPAGAIGRRAEAAALLADPSVVRPARLGAPRPNPHFDGAPALGFAMRPGSEIDPRLFSHRRSIEVPATPEGLARLRLRPEDLAVLKEDLSDLRIADDASRQWSYLVDRRAATDLATLTVEGLESDAGASRYVLRPPATPLRADRIVLDPTAPFFDRRFRIEADPAGGATSPLARGGGGTRVLAEGRLVRSAGERRPVTVHLEPERVETLRLIVEDGDDAPLVFRTVRARVILPDLYLAVPSGRYDLLLGSPDQEAPRYELERVRDVVLAVNAVPIEAGPLEANRDRGLRARLAGRGLRQTVLLWAALIAAVVILTALSLRLARRDPDPRA